MHCYWKLSEPLPAERVDEQTGAVVDLIERANLRLIHALGSDPDGKPSVADRQCANRDRVMRLAGSVNWKTGRWARIVEADFALEPYRVAALVGDLPDPDSRKYTRTPLVERDDDDPYRQIPASEYMVQIAGLEPDRAGFGTAPTQRTRTATRPALSAAGARSCGSAMRAGRPARSTTSRRSCSAARGAADSSATTPSGAPAPTCSTSSAS